MFFNIHYIEKQKNKIPHAEMPNPFRVRHSCFSINLLRIDTFDSYRLFLGVIVNTLSRFSPQTSRANQFDENGRGPVFIAQLLMETFNDV